MSPPNRSKKAFVRSTFLTLKTPALLAFEDLRTAAMADLVADLAAEERGEGDEQRHDPHRHPEDAVRRHQLGVREQARDDEQRVAREQEAHEQAGLGEDDEAHHQQRPRPGRGDDRLGVEERDECGVDHATGSSRRTRRMPGQQAAWCRCSLPSGCRGRLGSAQGIIPRYDADPDAAVPSGVVDGARAAASARLRRRGPRRPRCSCGTTCAPRR